MHRIHALQHCLEEQHESWSSPDGCVVLLRQRGQKEWRAVVDVVLVTDAERVNGPLTWDEDPAMRAPTAHELAAKLAKQERIHLVFDA